MTTIYTFVPEFRTDVYTYGPNNQKWMVNPSYCATDKCAAELVEIFKSYDPVIVQTSPTGQMGGMFSTDLVAALQIVKDGKTVVILAGFLASYFKYLGPTAGCQACIQEIETTLMNA